ncbi:hypothetical protein [Amycolatopsis sp. cmx-11-12]|uniref:hypothetical protein n=1 Tax=Amycolatopsis sp. cmx-11-12 TaxID=2785795 RepID=UPI0039186234
MTGALPSWLTEGTQMRVREMVNRGFVFDFGGRPDDSQHVFGETPGGEFDKVVMAHDPERKSFAWRLKTDSPTGPSSLHAEGRLDAVLDAVLGWPALPSAEHPASKGESS